MRINQTFKILEKFGILWIGFQMAKMIYLYCAKHINEYWNCVVYCVFNSNEVCLHPKNCVR